ncbi:MAG: YbaY family lipoprotein [Proteobacteria bacterium]|nr:YbaY family lipoprotein [Pseudomonadota bacterium]
MTDTKPLSLGLLSLVLLLAGCSVATSCPEARQRPERKPGYGSITYRERIALPPTAVVTVRLVDVSLADAPSVLVAEQVIRTAGQQVPFEFALDYDASRIQPSHAYAVQVRIEDGGRLLFISDTMNPVITRGAPTRVDMVVRRS